MVDLTGQTLHAEPKLSFGTILFSLLAVSGVGLAFATNEYHWLIASILPALIAVAIWSQRPAGLTLEVGNDRIRFVELDLDVTYPEIEGLTLGGLSPALQDNKLKSQELCVYLNSRVIRIPAGGNVSTPSLYEFLCARIPSSGSGRLPTSLEEYARQQAEEFGSDRVFTLGARKLLRHPSSIGFRSGLAVFVTGLVWVGIGATVKNRDFEDWLGGGVFLTMIGIFWTLIAGLARRPQSHGLKNWESSGLVITPLGIALKQGDISGKLRWDELKDLKLLGGRSGSFTLTSGVMQGIQLIVEGATIVVVDIYDRPQAVIYSALRNYWRGPTTKANG